MSQESSDQEHVRPYVFRDETSRSMHFSLHEIQSRMRLHDPHALDLRYTRTMMGFLMFAPCPQRIMMMGLGGGSLAKFCHHHLPQAHMDVVEINPHVIALREEFGVPADGPRFRVIQADGARFIREVVQHYDVLLLDAFDDQGLPGPLASARFYRDCADALQPGGVLVANLPASLQHLSACLQRIRMAFGGAVLVVGDDDLENVVVFAFKLGVGQSLACHVDACVCPAGLDASAREQLMPAFDGIAQAWARRVSARTKEKAVQSVD